MTRTRLFGLGAALTLLAAALVALTPAASASCAAAVGGEGSASVSCAAGCDAVSLCVEPLPVRETYDALGGPAWPVEDVRVCLAAAPVAAGAPGADACSETHGGNPAGISRVVGECVMYGGWMLRCWLYDGGIERVTLWMY